MSDIRIKIKETKIIEGDVSKKDIIEIIKKEVLTGDRSNNVFKAGDKFYMKIVEEDCRGKFYMSDEEIPQSLYEDISKVQGAFNLISSMFLKE